MIPSELTARAQWVVWCYEKRDGRRTKVPYQAVAPTDRGAAAGTVRKRRASSTDPSTWRSYHEATIAHRDGPFDGIGFVVCENDPIVGVDLDDALDAGIKPGVGEIVQRLGSYTERSPSGNGLRIFLRASLNGGRNRTNKTPWGGAFEVYARARFLTVTGDRFGEWAEVEERQAELDAVVHELFPPEPERTPPVAGSGATAADQEILERARGAHNGPKFEALWGGDHGAYSSPSEADLALCSLLAFWTGPDPARIDALFRQSGLMRDKWNRDDYAQETIAKALAGRTEFYDWDKPKAKRDASELTSFVVPENILEELREKGVSDEDVESADSLADLAKLLGTSKDNKATAIVKLVLEAGVELFHDDASRTYATFQMAGHAETWPTGSQPFRRYMRRLYYDKHESAPTGQALTDALGVLEGKAQFDGRELDVHFRVAGDARRIVVDLGDAEWRAIEITSTGWRVLDHHPVKFRRTGGMLALPTPVPGGNVELLRPLVNVADDDAWRLAIAWLLAALRPGSPYPVLIAHGEQGSAKSTLGRVLRALVDPNSSPLRVAPHDVDDLMVSATSSWVVAYDNVSRIPPSLSDALCRLSTGGGLSKRQLYTDSDEVLLDAMRPVILNGIEELANRSDLLDRALLIEMPVIAEDRRSPEDEFWAAFARVHAEVLGGICDALVAALAGVAGVRLDRLPRMADFAKWVTAAEPTLGWEPGAFLDAYHGNRAQAHEVAIDASVIGPTLLAVADEGFEGTMSGLLDALAAKAGEKAAGSKDWPKSARALSAEIKRLSPNLRHLGYEVVRDRTPGGKRQRVASVRRLSR